jgi:cysteine desulfurase
MDHGATTPLREEALEAMLPYLKEKFGNPSSIHSFGREARKAINEAREKTARALGADPEEIFFTSGGTESNNMAIRGAARLKGKGRIITSAIEHHAVLDVCKDLEKDGFEVVFLPVDRYGMVDPRAVEEAIVPGTILVSIMMGNNEVGTIQPIREICTLARKRGVFVHTDAVQCVGQLPVDVKELQVDFLSLSAHKFNGPKGVGALYVRKGIPLPPIYRGGGQERKLRPGTENVAGIVGLGRALELAVAELPEKTARLQKLRDRLIAGLTSLEGVALNGHPKQRLPGNVHLSFQYIEGESLLLGLDLQGVAASSGSACTSGSLEPSHVLLALGLPHEIAHGSLRLTLGDDNTREDVDYVLEKLPIIVNRLREMSPLFAQEKGGMKNV